MGHRQPGELYTKSFFSPFGSSGSFAATGSHFLKGKGEQEAVVRSVGLSCCSLGTQCRESWCNFCTACGPLQGNCALVLAEKAVSHRQPHIAVHSYLAGVLLVQVEAYFLPCSLDSRTIRGSSHKSLL